MVSFMNFNDPFMGILDNAVPGNILYSLSNY
jgi:hypothetical protein